MSGELIAQPSAEAEIDETDSFSDATESENTEDQLQTNRTSEDGYDHSGGGDGSIELAFANTMNIPEYQDKLKVIHDRITRIVNRISYLTQSLKQVHQGLKNYTNDKAEETLPPAPTDVQKAVGDNDSTQTDPLIKPELNMLAERVGDSVGCQTIEDDPFAD